VTKPCPAVNGGEAAGKLKFSLWSVFPKRYREEE